jgi:16S rRNA (uracil1498-N3)-methyltransferase
VRLEVGAPSPVMPIALVLAVPRPKVLSRTLEIAASFAVARIDLTNAWKVDKAYLKSPWMAAEAIEASLLRGASQGATTQVPDVAVHSRLMPLMETLTGGLIAHPGAPPLEHAYRGGATTVAIGPEGGWIDREVEAFIARGFQPVSIGAPILRVEAAVAALLGQLALLARMV